MEIHLNFNLKSRIAQMVDVKGVFLAEKRQKGFVRFQ